MRSTVFSVFILIFVLGCSNSDSPRVDQSSQSQEVCSSESKSAEMAKYIIGGVSSQQDTPWMGYLVAQNRRYQWECAATLIDSQWAVTAAHCVDGARSVFLSLGSREYASGEIITVETYIQHEDYNDQTIENDIALLKLSSEVSYQPILISPKSLVQEMHSNSTLYNVHLLGWGIAEQGVSEDREASS